MTQDVTAYLSTHRDAHLNELSELLRIPSISALSAHKKDIEAAAGWLSNALQTAGLEHVQIFPTEGHPVVYADSLHAPGAPTVLIYGHYDVQPVDPLHLWQTGPFEPSIRDGKLYARGATDDKGQTFLHIKALEAILKTRGQLPVNVKVCIEGEEEIGSPHLPAFVEAHKDLLAADVLIVSDSSILAPGQPAICYGLRGLCGLQVDVRAANSDLHSGTYGGAVPNAVHGLVELLASLHDAEGKVLVDGFYDEVRPLTPEERETMAAIPFDEAEYKTGLGVRELVGEPGYTTVERTWARPTLELNGVFGGFQGEGTKTVIPAEAHAKITCRLVNDQDPAVIMERVERHLLSHAPKGTTVSVTRYDTGRPVIVDLDSPYIEAAAAAYEAGYGKQPHYIRMGGSIPIVETFYRLLKLPVVLMGFGLETENLHAPNEHFHLDNMDRGLVTLAHWYTHLPHASK